MNLTRKALPLSVPSLADKLRTQTPTVGSWMSLGVPAVAEIMADAGFEWLVVDLEHSAITLREAEELIRVVDLKGLPALVRLSSNDPVLIKRVLDAGARGIIVPQVNSVEEAEAAVSATRYPPTGKRGVGLARAQGYGPGFDAYVAQSETELVVIAQIENFKGVEHLEAIVGVQGIDATIIGPYDLSASVGCPGCFDDPKVVALLETYEEICRRVDAPMGYHVTEPRAELILERIELGYSFLALSTDFLFLGDACRREVRAVVRDIANSEGR